MSAPRTEDALLAERRWKRPIPPFLIRPSAARPDPAIVASLCDVSVTAVADRVGRMYTMGPEIRSLYQPAVPVVGCATTVKCPPGDNLGVMKALALVEAGDVLVVDAQGFTDWCLGGFEILAWARHARGLRGIVVNGAYRDVEEAQAARFPLYAKAIAPFSGPKLGPAEINVPVCCGGVIVHPGDIVCASAEGIAVVPRDALAAVADALEPRQATTPIAQYLQIMAAHVQAYFDAGSGKWLD